MMSFNTTETNDQNVSVTKISQQKWPKFFSENAKGRSECKFSCST